MTSIYSPLDAGKREIRVLTIDEQTSEDSLVACSLKVVSLDDEPCFTALSYCWGAPKPAGEILLDGNAWPVTPNLAAALRHLRNTKDAETTPIWIDAVCINQNDLDERSAQVAMMMSIYAQAECVHVWLGDETGPAPDAMTTLEEVFAISDCPDGGMARRCQNLVESWHQRSSEHIAQKLGHMIQIGESPYWQRTWILQEVSFARIPIIYAKDSRVRLGPSEESVDDPRFVGLLALNNVIEDLSSETEAIIKHHTSLDPSIGLGKEILRLTVLVKEIMKTIVRVNWNKRIGSIRRLEGDIGAGACDKSHTGLFIVYRQMQSTDPKDKIYGLLGFVFELSGMTPDYTKSVRSIYCEATLRLIRAAKDLTYLHQACFDNSILPSWALDYSTPCAWPSLAVVEHSVSAWRYSGSSFGSQAHPVQPDMDFKMDANNALLVQGFTFDVIVSISKHTPFDHTDLAAVRKTWNGWISSCPALLQRQTDRHGDPSTRVANLYEHVANTRFPVMDWLGGVSGIANQVPESLVREIGDFINDFEVIVSERGYVGIAPKGLADTGDSLAIIAGAGLPFCVSTRPSRSGRQSIRLKAPIVVDGNVVECGVDMGQSRWSKYAALVSHVAWVKGECQGLRRYYSDASCVMSGAVVFAEAVRRFDDPSRAAEVFEDMAII